MNARHAMSGLAAAFAILLLASALMPACAALTNAADVTVHLSGPSVLGTLRSGTFSATLVDPQDREWTYRAWITADNTTGAAPLKDTPVNGTLTSTNDTFTFDVTGQQSPGELEIHINCTTGTLYYEKVQTIDVVAPITLSVSIDNPSNVEISNATVQFYVDGVKIDEQTTRIASNQATTVFTDWVSRDKEPGWHDSRIVVDLNGDGTIDTSLGDMVVEDRFFVEGGSDWVFAVTVVIGLAALILGFGYISKRKMK